MLLVVFLTDTRVDMYSLHAHMHYIMAEEELQIFPAKLRDTSTHAQKVGGATKLEVEVSLNFARKMWTSYYGSIDGGLLQSYKVHIFSDRNPTFQNVHLIHVAIIHTEKHVKHA